MTLFVSVGPGLKIFGELVVCDDVDRFEVGNGCEVIQDPFDHRLPRDFQERLRPVQGERIESCRGGGGETEKVHARETSASVRLKPASCNRLCKSSARSRSVIFPPVAPSAT